MKKVVLLFILSISITGLYAQSLTRCGTTAYNQVKAQADGNYLSGIEAARQRALTYRGEHDFFNAKGAKNVTVRMIPVVVHVIYKTASQNISASRVQQQITILNHDYMRLNADAGKTRPVFQSVATACNVQFFLATKDPSGNPTSGITYTSTATNSFNPSADDMKFTSTGGHDAWNTSEYMNIWVCNLSGGVLGITTFPGGPANVDGVVIGSDYFGPNPSAEPYDLGRTTTHEVGHYFGLDHPFGTYNCSNSNCTVNGDYMCCTPPESAENFGCDFSVNTCSTDVASGSPFTSNVPDQIENYMDYSDDSCMNMFCNDQAAYMHATLNTDRSSLGFDSSVFLSDERFFVISNHFPVIAPNPSAGDYFITSFDAVTAITVYDFTGKIIFNKAYDKVNQLPLSLVSYPNGVYIFSIQTPSGISYQKVVKQ